MSLSIDLAKEIAERARTRGADDVIVRAEEWFYEAIVFDNGVLRSYTSSLRKGVGIKVIVKGVTGYSYTHDLSRESVDRAIDRAIAVAKRGRGRIVYSDIRSRPAKGSYSFVSKTPMDYVDPSEKVSIVGEANREVLSMDGITSSVTRLGFEKHRRIVVSSFGAEAECEVHTVGFSQISVAKHNASSERVADSRSWIGGFEHIKGFDYVGFAKEVGDLALRAARAPMPSPGTYRAVIDSELVGLLVHEAFGHASEGDLVIAGASVLAGRVGEQVASELITIVDQGVVEGGYPVPFDDEGNEKVRTVVVDRGILRSFLTGSFVASELNTEVTGNARAESVSFDTLIRQTNYFIEAGDWSFEEMVRDTRNGLYLRGRGALGGQVDPSNGAFTFSIGPSYVIRNGEIAEMVRGVTVSGTILETLRSVDAVGKDLTIRTSVFGGCGKNEQMVRVGDGGPHVRVGRIVVGGV